MATSTRRKKVPAAATKSRRGGRVAIDQDKMGKDRKRADKRGQGADLWQVPEGETLVYICPPVHEEDPVPYVEFQAHFSVGPNSRQIVNLEFLEDVQALQTAIDGRDAITWDAGVEGWEFMGEYADDSGNDRIKLKPRWMFNIVPMQHRRNKRDKWQPADGTPMMLACGKTIYDGITDLLFDEGDITDPDSAILVKIVRKGTKLSTEYTVSADTTSLKEPIELEDEMWEAIETYLAPGKEGDMYRQLAYWIRDLSTIKKVIAGKEDDDDDDDDDEPKAKRKRSTKVATAASRRRKKVVEPEPEEEEEEYDDVEEEEAEEELEEEELEEEELEEEELEEEEEIPEPVRRRAPRKKKVVEPEPEEEEEEEVPEPPKKKPATRRRKAPVKKAAAEPEEEEDDADALEAALQKRTRRRRTTK